MPHSVSFLLKTFLNQGFDQSRQIISSRGIVSISQLALGLPAFGLRKKAFTSLRPGQAGNNTSPLPVGQQAARPPGSRVTRDANNNKKQKLS
jgi:hypothetical protein